MNPAPDDAGALFVVGTLLLQTLALGVIAWYFRGSVPDARERWLAAPCCSGGALAFSLVVALSSPLTLALLPGEAYDVGWLSLVVIPAFLAAALLGASVLAPVWLGLKLRTPAEYFAVRHDNAMRRWCGMVYMVTRLVGLAGLVGWGAELLVLGLGWNVPIVLVAIGLGLMAILVVGLGGTRAVVGTDVLHGLLLIAAVVTLTVTIVWSVPGGREEIVQAARVFGRADSALGPAQSLRPWSSAARVLGLIIWLVALVADPMVVQRMMLARQVGAARRGVATAAIWLAAVAGALTFVGLGLLSFYHHHPTALRPKWVVNIDSVTRRSLTDPATRGGARRDPLTGRPITDLVGDSQQLDPTRGRPLLDWRRDDVTTDTVDALLAAGRLLHPNTKQPLTSRDELMDADGANLDPLRLAMRRPTVNREVILHERANTELTLWFTSRQIPTPLRGLVIAAFAGGILSWLIAGNSVVGTILAHDMALGAAGANESEPAVEPNSVAASHEGKGMAWLTIVAWIAALVAGAAASLIDGLCPLLFEWSVALMVPSWAVLAVSLTSRRATSGTQRLALISGLVVASGLVLAQRLCGETEWFGVWVPRWDAAWTPVAAFCFTALAGYAAASIGGRLATRHELRGLVIGCGELGDRRDRPPPPKFTVVERWR